MSHKKEPASQPEQSEQVSEHDGTNVDSNVTTVTDAEIVTDDSNNENSTAELAVFKPKGNTGLAVKPETKYDLNVKSFEDLTLGAQLAIFQEMSTDPSTGITNPAMGLLKFQKAKELRIPWANAVPHMHIIKGRVGIDINICQAILQRPGSGVTWEYIEQYEPVYDYVDASGNIYPDGKFPPNIVKINTLKDPVEPGKVGVILKPTIIGNKVSYNPSDFRTTIKFTRKKKDIDGSWITVTEIGTFSWQDACTAKLPYSSGTTVIDPNSNWAKRPKFMIYKSAFWDGAKKIANDLLNGADDVDALMSIPD